MNKGWRAGIISLSLFLGSLCLNAEAWAGDWPQWRYDAGRTADTPENLGSELFLQWVRQYPALKPAFPGTYPTKAPLRKELDAIGPELATWVVNGKLGEFDKGYEPIVLGSTMFLGSSLSDRLTAIDIATGEEKWRYYVNGPIRYAPVAYQGLVIFGSDDGCVYGLRASNGALVWKFQAAPAGRRHLGNHRLISAWPVRGGPVLHKGKVYLGAGNWPFEGTFYFCLDAATGRIIWENSTSGTFFRFMNGEGYDRLSGGPIPLGYFVIDGNHLVTPSGRDRPVRWDLHTGQFIVDQKKNAMQQIHARESGQHGPDRFALTKGRIGEITASGKIFKGYPGVQGTLHNLLAAQGRLFVVTNEGSIYCFGPKRLENPATLKDKGASLQSAGDKWKAFARAALSHTSGLIGYCLVLGAGTGRLAEELVLQSRYRIVVVDPNPARVEALRRKFDAAGVYGERISVQLGNPLKAGLPPFMARLIVSEDLTAAGLDHPAEFLRKVVFSLRPYGGIAAIELPQTQHQAMADSGRAFETGTITVERSGEFSILKRPGPLPGSANARGSSGKSDDLLVKGPMGVLWYGGDLDWDAGDVFYDRHAYMSDWKRRGWAHHRPFADDVIDGEIRIYGPAHVTYVDAYTGLVLRKDSKNYVPWHKGGGLPPLERDGGKVMGEQLREAHPYFSLNVLVGTRKNPLTGKEEDRIVSRGAGCGGVIDWGLSPLATMRSGYAAYYDKSIESGTIHLAPVRAGCRPTIIPANGVLTVMNHAVGCGCNYPLFTSAVFAPTPVNDMWTAWGPCINFWDDEVYGASYIRNPSVGWDNGKGYRPYREKWDARTHNKMGVLIEGSINRIGINLGAPGDRMSPDGGTLWLNYPDIGGPSPEVEMAVQPENVNWVRRHSFRIKDGQGYRFVSATSGEGIESVRVKLYSDVERAFTVRLYFAEHDETIQKGDRRFSASIQGLKVDDIDIVAETGRAHIGLVKEYKQIKAKDDLTVTLAPTALRQTLLSGIEIVAADVALGAIPRILPLDSDPWLGGE
jgi:outer membrane protein assembly factor BamB/SAM-dependent methyltransferase